MAYVSNPHTWIVVLTTVLIAMSCNGLHFEIFSHCRTYLKTPGQHRRRDWKSE